MGKPEGGGSPLLPGSKPPVEGADLILPQHVSVGGDVTHEPADDTEAWIRAKGAEERLDRLGKRIRVVVEHEQEFPACLARTGVAARDPKVLSRIDNANAGPSS